MCVISRSFSHHMRASWFGWKWPFLCISIGSVCCWLYFSTSTVDMYRHWNLVRSFETMRSAWSCHTSHWLFYNLYFCWILCPSVAYYKFQLVGFFSVFLLQPLNQGQIKEVARVACIYLGFKFRIVFFFPLQLYWRISILCHSFFSFISKYFDPFGWS